MKKEFIPYEQSRTLKELGFDEDCFAYCNAIYKYDIIKEGTGMVVNSSLESNEFTMILWQQAFQWFREKGFYHQVEICQEKHPLKSKYSFSIYVKDFYKEYPKEYGWVDNFPMFKTYEETRLECLKKLIEIVILKKKRNNVC